jgi:hypothetical protein
MNSFAGKYARVRAYAGAGGRATCVRAPSRAGDVRVRGLFILNLFFSDNLRNSLSNKGKP